MKKKERIQADIKNKKVFPSNDPTKPDCDSDHTGSKYSTDNTGEDHNRNETKTIEKKGKSKLNKQKKESGPAVTVIGTKAQ